MGLLKRSKGADVTPETETPETDTQDASRYVTRAEFDALISVVGLLVHNLERARQRGGFADGSVGYRLERLAESPEDFGVAGEQRRLLLRVMRALDKADDLEARVDRRRAAANATSARAFNY